MFDELLPLARDVLAKKLKVGDKILMDEGFVEIFKISCLKPNKIGFYQKDGRLILSAFPSSEILAARK